MVVALNIIVIIHLNSYSICGEEVIGKDGIKGIKEETTRNEEERLLIELIPEFYSNYRDVLNNTNETKSLRRIFKNNREFQMHIEKLKGVNGLKTHNLVIKESTKDNPVIYIDNPVETKIPNAYLTQEDFKNMLTERISKQRDKFKADYLKPKINKDEPIAETEINMGTTKGKSKNKLTTLLRTEESTTLATTTTQTQKLNEEKEIKAQKDKKNQNSPENGIKGSMKDITTKFQEKEHNISKLQKIVKNTLENATKDSVDATTVGLVGRNLREGEIVGYTPENAGITTEYKEILTTVSEVNVEQNVSKLEENNPLGDVIEENTPAGMTEDIQEVITEPTEEETSNLEEVTEETTTTTVQTKRTRLSRPLVWLGNR